MHPVEWKIAAGGSFWMEFVARTVTMPWGNGPSYKEFRNVKGYGAVSDSKTVSTKIAYVTMHVKRK